MTGRAIPGGYETWSKEDELRAQLAAANKYALGMEAAANTERERAEAAEAKLAAVPVDDIRKVWSAAPKNTATQSAILRVGDWLQARV